MKLSLVMIFLASATLPACALDGSAPTPTGTDDSRLDDPTCGTLYRAYQDCDAREAHYDADGKRIAEYSCVAESNAWAECVHPRPAYEAKNELDAGITTDLR